MNFECCVKLHCLFPGKDSLPKILAPCSISFNKYELKYYIYYPLFHNLSLSHP